MNLTQTQLLLLIATVVLAAAYLVSKVLEVKHEKLDLEMFTYATGFGAFFALLGTLNSFGVFN